jgi:hypothetical protein
MQTRWRETYSKWHGLISEQHDSGQSVRAFCQGRGLTTSQFFAWKKRLRESGAEQFVEVRLERSSVVPPKAHSVAIEVQLAEGRRIRVEPGFDPDHLRAVVNALEARG